MWTRQLRGRLPQRSGLARQRRRIAACWRQASPCLAWGIVAVVASLCLVGGASGAGGDLVWEDQVDKAGGFDGVNALAVAQGRLCAAGFVTNAAGNVDVLIRAYEAKTGALLWEDQVDEAGLDEAALALSVREGQVFIAGFGTKAAGNNDFLVRAYQAKTGALVWEELVDKAGLSEAAVALAAGGGQVVAGGVGTNAAGNFDVLIRAYEVK
jgi:outer membrane protein assembly factor BamB